MTATDTTVKDLSGLNLEGAVETVLSDGVVVGGVYNYNAAVAKPEEVYLKKSFETKLVSTRKYSVVVLKSLALVI